jgi:hypothetical protein
LVYSTVKAGAAGAASKFFLGAGAATLQDRHITILKTSKFNIYFTEFYVNK